MCFASGWVGVVGGGGRRYVADGCYVDPLSRLVALYYGAG